MTIYHVAQNWNGKDLISLFAQVFDRGVLSEEAAVAMIAGRWSEYAEAPAEYLHGDGTQIHCHDTLEQAAAYQAEFGGEILAIDVADAEDYGFCVKRGTEYDHPVIEGIVPAGVISRA